MHWKSGRKGLVSGQELMQTLLIEQGYYMNNVKALLMIFLQKCIENQEERDANITEEIDLYVFKMLKFE